MQEIVISLVAAVAVNSGKVATQIGTLANNFGLAGNSPARPITFTL